MNKLKTRYFDLHCDTLTELFDRGESLHDSSCLVSEMSISSFEKYGQITAVFSKVECGDEECFERFLLCTEEFKKKNNAEFCLSGAEIMQKTKDGLPSFVLSVEDARLLAGDISRVKRIYDAGVRIMTPLWKGVSCIGGAFDTKEGLTDFGREAVHTFLSLGGIPDISHASRRSAKEIFDAAKNFSRPVIASHSNSYSVYPHERNLTDEEALKVEKSGGIVGISFAPQHLSAKDADFSKIFSHTDFYINLIGEDALALGCDFDGTDATPAGISSQYDINIFAEALRQRYKSRVAEKILYENAYNFLRAAL